MKPHASDLRLMSLQDASSKRGDVLETIDPTVEGTLSRITRTTRPDSDVLASRAYKQAVSTLATLTALPPMQSEEPSHHSAGYPLSSFLPSIQGQGPIASAMRILVKLKNHSWLPSVVTDYLGRELSNGRRREEEARGKAVKVIDLLQHAAELGHSDAMYTLGQISLVSTSMILPTFGLAQTRRISSRQIPTFPRTLRPRTSRSTRTRNSPETRPLKP